MYIGCDKPYTNCITEGKKDIKVLKKGAKVLKTGHESIKKLAMARYECKGCFIKDGKRENTYFSLFDKANLFDFDKTKKSTE